MLLLTLVILPPLPMKVMRHTTAIDREMPECYC